MDINSTDSWNPVRVLAAVLLLGLFGSGYAISTQLESSAAVAIPPPSATVQDQAPFVYFPSQYVNQAQHAEEHIQAF